MECHVAHHMNMLHDGIVRVIRLEATLVANEDHLAAMVLQLLHVQRCVPDVYDEPKRHEVVHRHLLPKPCHKRGHVIHTLHWTPVQYIYNSTLHFTPESSRKALALSMILAVGTTVPF
jgi:hypothetical protein